MNHEQSRLELFVAQALNFIGAWMRPPKIANIDLSDADQSALTLVEPTFVLSTGRCGTKWLTELLGKDHRMRLNHNDYPELLRQSRMAYEGYEKNPILFQEILRVARDGYLLDAYRRNQTYVETNHRITFFAHAIRQVYPKARFIHLCRHPGDFVCSGIRRNWYSGNYYDLCRPRMQDDNTWKQMTKIEKLGWLWNETNQYIDSFLTTLDPPSLYLKVKAEEMFCDIDVGAGICAFTGAQISRRAIASLHAKKINQQWTGSMLSYDRWKDEQKKQLQNYVPLSEEYDYVL